jgi:ABC-type xylose transport system permease subunit
VLAKPQLAALTNGFQVAFATAIVFAAIGLLVAVAFLQLATRSRGGRIRTGEPPRPKRGALPD